MALPSPLGSGSSQGSGPAPERALTWKSAAATVFITLVAGIAAQLAGVLDGGESNSKLGSEALPVPIMLVFLPLLAASTGIAALARVRLFSRAELVGVLYASMIAMPLMTLGFWRYQLAGHATIVRIADWTKFEALPEGLWPHGDDLLQGALGSSKPTLSGGSQASVRGGTATISNAAPSDRGAVRIRVSLGAETRPPRAGSPGVAVPGRPYLFTALVRARDLGPDSSYFVRVYADDDPTFAFEPVSGRQEAKPTLLLPDGFQRVGTYPMPLPEKARRSVTFELGLSGTGRAEWKDPKLYDVRAIEAAYQGFTRVTAAEYAKLPVADRQTSIVVPDSLFSRAGVRYLVGLDYPIRDWLGPTLRLGVFALLTFGITFGLSLVYRRQWLENERYGVPMARIPLVLLGADEAQGGLGARFFKNHWLWVGFGIALPWCLLRIAHGYDPTLPDLSMRTGLKGYLTDPFWGRTWDGVEFKLLVTFFALSLLMELNILLSLVLGYFAFRLQLWFATAHGFSNDQDFPYFQQQMLGAYIVYSLLLLVFTRRYLFGVIRSAIGRGPVHEERWTERAGLGLVAGGFVGFVLWGRWLGLPLLGVLLLGAHVAMLGFISAKFRAECGLPMGGHNHPLEQSGNINIPVSVLLLVPILGGMPFLGANTLLTMTIVGAVLLPYGFFSIPGLQIELLEVGRRFGVRTRELGAIALFGLVVAVVVGGWIYLVSAYGFGATKFPVASEFGERMGAFRTFNAELSAAQAALDAAAQAGPAPTPTSAKTTPYWAIGFGGASATVITLLRQWFPGFWFHPVGLLVGPSSMLSDLWGSLLVAYLVRWTVLRLGGAATVREKLVPCAIGIFLAAVVVHGVYIPLNGYYFFFNKGNLQFTELL